MTDAFPFPFTSSPAACLITIVSMAKVGIVGQREDTKPGEESVELGER